MSVKVIIPTALRQFAGKQDSLDFSARTVGEALDSLTGRYEELRKHLYANDGRLRSFVNVYVNDEDIRYLSKDQTPVKDGDTISIIPSIAGGIARSGDRVIG
ncbi:MAG: MoaD/ThiS family protein [Candidatus Acidiferrales bacterium]